MDGDSDAHLEHIREGFQILSPDWRYLYVNPAVCEHAQKTREELLGARMHDVFPGIEHTDMFAALVQCQQQRRSVELLNEFRYADGQTRWFELRVQPVPQGIAVLSLDVTERRRLEDQLRASQRLEAIGRLAGGVAHDFNNILTAIIGFGELARPCLDGHPAAPEVDEMIRAAWRAEGLVAQLLTFARRQAVKPQVFDVHERLSGLDAMLQRILAAPGAPGATALRSRSAPGAGRVCIDPTAFDQVVVNLVVNARDAGGGEVAIDAAPVVLDAEYPLGKGVAVIPGRYTQITVSDRGTGMDEATRSRLFEPFFTTKPPGAGTGLGLSTCYGIVKQAGGYIWVYSELGRGTSVKVYLPRVDLPGDAAAPAPAGGAGRGRERVWVIEDDASVRALVARALEHWGYVVQAVAAVGDAERLDGAPDLVLTDLTLPDGSGPDVVRRLAERSPRLRWIVMSGYTERGATAGDDALHFLPKPFTLEQLARAVRDALDAPPGAPR